MFFPEKSVCAEHSEQLPLHATVKVPPIIAADGQDALTLGGVEFDGFTPDGLAFDDDR